MTGPSDGDTVTYSASAHERTVSFCDGTQRPGVQPGMRILMHVCPNFIGSVYKRNHWVKEHDTHFIIFF